MSVVLRATPGAANWIEQGHLALAGGRLADANLCFRHAQEADPGDPAALQGLALVAFTAGDHAGAEALAREALKRAPRSAPLHALRGRALKALGRLDEARSAYRRSLTIDPHSAEVHVSLGVVVRAKGDGRDAVTHYRRALGLKPALYEAYVNLENATAAAGLRGQHVEWLRRFAAKHAQCPQAQFFLGKALFETGERAAARAAFAAAVALDAGFTEARDMLAEVDTSDSRFRPAVLTFRRAIADRPDDPELHYNLGVALRNEGDGPAAVQALVQAIRLRPDHVEAHRATCHGLLGLGLYTEALGHAREVMRLEPDKPASHLLEGQVLQDAGRISAAIEAFRRALALDAGEFHGQVMLAGALLLERRHEEALAGYRAAADLRPDHPVARQNLLFAMNYAAEFDAAAVARAHRAFGEEMVQRIAPLSPVASDWRPGTRPLRVGLLSADFKNHSVSYFIEPLLARHDRDRLALVCYSNGSFGDTITLRLRDHATEWVGTATWSDSQLARRIREDAIDILVDLSGHTGGNRLSMLALKPAPVQVTWLGYPTTTGLPTIDYRITDARVDPPGYEACASERPLRLPASYFCYRPRSEPRIGPLPADAGRPITFGSFNNMPKLGAATIRLWSRVLHALPDATLFVKTKALADASVRDALLASFATEGICAQRLRAIGWLPSGEEHLAAYNEVDIALDTFPYNGATTTCEALWMGVPVVSLAGSTHASRMGLSILTAVGLPELVASSEDGFVALAAALAQERDRLRALRQTLRERMRASPLMDEAGHAAAVADALEAAMREHLGLAPVEAGGARP